MIRDFFRDKPGPQRWMLGAIVLNFLSQFLLYSDAPVSVPTYRTDGYGALWVILPEGYGSASGWELHWHAAPILLLLAVFFANDEFPHGKSFARFGWWAAAALLFAACLPTALEVWGFGTMWGFVSVLVALGAAAFNARSPRPAKPTA
ncbi:MAG: hypothetical protein BGO82_09380 [Devosia sp. 67-54]|uniref:hypothetical protein n=1 Tax=unclassified Devosia TaxID=196773 RepID=UPI00095ADAED|nr:MULTISPECIES: hypothetical protein [unclassified Devosia]MBN9305159.1 hypothetical protein [Devosia sp.]OJX14917.1 MAG: hypothetical protein BGO82_09380 [Devosia sp. 67-54]